MEKLLCGASKRCITPPMELLSDLFGLMRSSFHSIHDDLYVRVIALQSGNQKMLLIGYDLDKAPFPVEYVKEVEKETGVPAENMFYFGIHAHAVPITGYRPFEVRNDITKKEKRVQDAVHQYEELIRKQLLEASREAMACLQPCRYGYGFGKSYINARKPFKYVNRRKGTYSISEGWQNDEKTDRTLFVMRFEDVKGKPLAFFINYPMHNVSMFLNDDGSGKSAVSSDIGGTVSKYMEREFDHSTALWSSGPAGDINCIIPASLAFPDPETGSEAHRQLSSLEVTSALMEYMAAIHFQDILRVNGNIRRMSDHAELVSATEYSRTPASSNALTRKDYEISRDRTYNIRLRLIKIGDLAMIGVNGELFSSFGPEMKKVSPAKDTVLVTHESSLLLDNPGYIFDDDTIYAAQEAEAFRLPGGDQFIGVPGTIGSSLQNCVRKLFGLE